MDFNLSSSEETFPVMGDTEEEKDSSVVQGCRAFASKFHRVISRENGGNIVTSPFSIHLMLSYLFHGSDGLSAKEIVAALCLLNVERLDVQYNAILKSLDGIRIKPGYGYGTKISEEDLSPVSVASAIFVQKGVELEKTFKWKGSAFYFFNAKTVDFRDKDNSAQSINSWVSKKTKNKITNVLTPGDITDLTKVIMVNAIYLKLKWRYPFMENSTQQEKFHITKSLKKQVPMMNQMNDFYYGELPSMKSRFILLPYELGDLDMVVILPDEAEGLKFVEDHFDWITIQKAQRFYGLTELRLPKFKIETSIDLKSIRHKLQLGSLFEVRGDFERMCSKPINPPLRVDSIVQKAFLDVNEAGTEAGAYSAVRLIGGGYGPPPGLNVFVVNRPFMVVIRDVSTNIPLFVANVRDIGEKPSKVKRQSDKTPIVRRSSLRLQAKRERESIKENQLKENKRPKK